MENPELLEILLNKYLSGKLTISERRQFNDLLADNANETVFKRLVHDHINEFIEENSLIVKEVDFDEIYSDILLKLDIDPTEVKHARHSLLKKILYTTAAAAVLTGVFLLGRIFPVSDSGTTDLTQYTYTEVKSPFGSRSEIKLPDGTSVILNAGSTLKYRNDFNQSNRNIDLYGEAYFKVARNPEVPLIVSAGYIDVIALGTEFNIKAYPEENTIETTLIEGSVEIANSGTVERKDDKESINLVPNQKAIFYKGEEGYRIESVIDKVIEPQPMKPFIENILISPKADVEKTVAWTEGRLIFRGENFENLCIDLHRKYDVNFVFIEDALKNYRFTGVLLDETLEQVLSVIKLSAPIDYSLEGKTVYLFADVSRTEKKQK